jgi:hypothetical protein
MNLDAGMNRLQAVGRGVGRADTVDRTATGHDADLDDRIGRRQR